MLLKRLLTDEIASFIKFFLQLYWGITEDNKVFKVYDLIGFNKYLLYTVHTM